MRSTDKNQFQKLGKIIGTSLVASTMMVASSLAQDGYPQEDIQFIIPFGVGGGSDTLARTIADVISELDLLPVGIQAENRPGGSGAVGYQSVAAEAGNPHVVATVSVSFFTTPLRGASPVSYRDFTPLAAISLSPYIMAVRNASPLMSVADVAAADRLTTATVGVVSDPSLLAAMTSSEMGLRIDPVPFDGEGEALAAVLGGHVDFVFMNPSEVLPQIEAGDMRALAVSTGERISALPETPTFAELGYDIEYSQLRGMVMPSDVPAEAVSFWEGVLQTVAESPQWREQYIERYLDEPAFLNSSEYQERIIQINDQYETLMRELGLL